MDFCFCVILYDTQPEACKTLSSLNKTLPKILPDAQIVVFNNGPKIVDITDKFDIKITLHNVLINGSLSKLYNKLICMYNANTYVFLDDDTEICLEYLAELKNHFYSILLPQIKCNGNLHYPIIKGKNIQTITSGLALTKSAIRHICSLQENVFDEALYLYGIDTAFCYALNKHKHPYTISKSFLEHNLSHITNENTNFRTKEVLVANCASIFKYPSLKLTFQVFTGLMRSLQKLDFQLFYRALCSMITQKAQRE